MIDLSSVFFVLAGLVLGNFFDYFSSKKEIQKLNIHIGLLKMRASALPVCIDFQTVLDSVENEIQFANEYREDTNLNVWLAYQDGYLEATAEANGWTIPHAWFSNTCKKHGHSYHE